MSLKIFLSHAWNDKDIAPFKAIEGELTESGYEVWVDKHQIDFGESITTHVEQGIRNADVVLVLWSRNAHASEAVQAEIEAATRLKKPLIACKVSDYEPGELECFRDRKYFSFDGPKLSVGLLHLSQYLARLRIKGSAAMQAHEGLQAQTAALNKMLAEMDDWAFRKEKGATGNAASSVYIARMLELGKNLVQTSDSGPEEKQRMLNFFDRVREISDKYPDPSQDALKCGKIAEAIDNADPHGQSRLLQGFKAILGQVPSTAQPKAPPVLQKPLLIQQIENHIRSVQQLPGSSQMLHQQLSRLVPPAEAAQAEAALNSMIEAVPQLLMAIAEAGDQAQVGHLLAPILQTAAGYFLQPQDLIPDHMGTLGLIDDTYLVHAFLYQINAEFAAQTGRPLVAVNIEQALQLMRAVLGPVISMQLDQAVLQSVQAVLQQAYAQQLAQWQQANGMSAVQPDPEQWSWGGTTEDEMARLSAKIGLSL